MGDDYTGKTADETAGRNKIKKSVTKNGNWLNSFCNGDLALLTKSGYPLQKESEAQGVLPQTKLSVVSEVGSGIMDFFIENLKGYQHVRYGIIYTAASNTEPNPALWTFYYASQKDGSISGFTIGQVYKFVSFGMGTEKEIVYSEISSVKAL